MAISKKSRFKILKRDGFRCGYCGRTAPDVTLEVDHIEPRSKGGKDDEENLIAACFDCNRGKRAMSLMVVEGQKLEWPGIEMCIAKKEFLKLSEQESQIILRATKNYARFIEAEKKDPIPPSQFIGTGEWKNWL